MRRVRRVDVGELVYRVREGVPHRFSTVTPFVHRQRFSNLTGTSTSTRPRS
jgi:hypothetical protein